MNEIINEAQIIKEGLEKTSIIAVTDSKGVITYVNSKFCEISGYEQQELIGKTHKIINSGFHDKDFFKGMWSSISSGNIWRGEIKNRDKEGHQYWVDTTIIPILEEDGTPYKYISIRNVITSQKLMAEIMSSLVSLNNLQNNKLYNSLLLEAVRILEMKSCIFSLKTKEDTFKTVAVVQDGKVCEPFEYSLEENPCIKTVSCIGIHIENDLQKAFPACTYAVENGLNSYIGVPLNDSEGNTLGILCLMDSKKIKHEGLFTQIINLVATRLKDEISRIEALQAMQESEACMRGVFSSAVDGIIMLDDNGVVQNINPSALKIFEACQADFVSQNILKFMPELYEGEKGKLSFKIPSRGGETLGVSKDGSQFPVYVSFSTVKLEGREFHSLFVRNLTEQKKGGRKA